MESEKRDSLQLHFKKSVPVAFIDRLIRHQPLIYEEARQQCFGNTVWGEAEAQWMLGYTERAMFESEMRKAAIECALRWEDAVHFGNNCTYVKVAAGNFRITAHRVSSPGCLVEPCESRKQDAVVNQFMAEYIDETLLQVPLPKLEDAKEIAIYLLHGTTLNRENKRALFLELAAPDFELKNYPWHCSLADLRMAYMADARAQGAEPAVEDKAKPKPKPKTKPKKREGTEGE